MILVVDILCLNNHIINHIAIILMFENKSRSKQSSIKIVGMNHSDSQIPDAPTHVYLLQMDSSISISSSEQVLPLHLLDNSLDYGRNQYILPIPTKQKEGQDQQLQVLIDSCQEPTKVMGLLVDKKFQNIQNQLSVSNIQPQKLSNEHSNTEYLSIERSKQGLTKPELNITVEVKNECKPITQKYVHISDRSVPPRALAVLPTVLQVQRRHIISTRRNLPMRARFGPVQGIKYKISHSEAVELVLNATSNKKALFLVKDKDNLITHIDTMDKDKSNWIGLLPLGEQNSANVWLYEENYELYAITTEIIPSRKPLMLGYSQKYAQDYGLIGPTKDIEIDESDVQMPWWCYECERVMPSANQLQRHMDLYHKEDKQIAKRRYRCRNCTRTFSRLFSLRRHTALHCPNKLDKRSNANNTEVETQINLNTSVCSEDNRLPSDESFQNYSNGLDFSTNLFDTDRIPSLDISGNSRCDNDFNPYSIGYRDETCVANDLDYTNKPDNPQTPYKEKRIKSAERAPCSYCNQIVIKEKRRQHVSGCPARRFECECKKVFTNKKNLTDHIFTQHSNESKTEKDNDNSPVVNTNLQGATPYKCEQCLHTFKRSWSQEDPPDAFLRPRTLQSVGPSITEFGKKQGLTAQIKEKIQKIKINKMKRRGMLVNHLWREHNTVSARVPLERRVRHYPCVICPKIYRTAAKRDRHVHVHHPGAEKLRGHALEGGTRVCEPAMCSACPRQYATRAKLLQHQRAHHPHLVPPPTNKKKPKKTKSREVVNTMMI